MILVFASSKGGVGKSTVCAAVGAALAERGDRVLILDLDQNRTVDRWHRNAIANNNAVGGLTVEAVPAALFTERMRDLSAQDSYDHVLIDLAGAREVTLFKAIARADLVIIPAQASAPDIREALASGVIARLGEGRQIRGNPAVTSSICPVAAPLAVLARTNASVMSEVIEAIGAGRKPYVVGGVADLLRLLDDVGALKQGRPGICPEFIGFASWAEVEQFAEEEEGHSLRPFLQLVQFHAAPFASFEQRGELHGRELHHPILDRRPAELTSLEPLGHQADAGAVPPQQLHAIHPLRSEHVDGAREWIGTERRLHDRGQAVGLLAEVDGLGRHQNLHFGARRDHDSLLTAASTAASADVSTSPRTRTTTSPTTISIPDDGEDEGDAAITTGMN